MRVQSKFFFGFAQHQERGILGRDLKNTAKYSDIVVLSRCAGTTNGKADINFSFYCKSLTERIEKQE